MSTDPESRENYGPYLPNIGSVCPSTGKGIRYNNVDDVREVLEKHGKNTAAFLVEPIQGEAGIVVPDDSYLREVRALCDKHNVLLICDEIQTGIARTGKMLCHEWSGIKPDLVLLGKAISGGMYPVSAVLGSREVMLTIEPGTHGSTYGGNPLGSAVAIRALELIQEENMVERAETMGQKFRQGLKDMNSPMITTIRGKGLLNAIVIDESKTNGHSAWDLCMLFKAKGLLVCWEYHMFTNTAILTFPRQNLLTRTLSVWHHPLSLLTSKSRVLLRSSRRLLRSCRTCRARRRRRSFPIRVRRTFTSEWTTKCWHLPPGFDTL
jgi:ornithine--oxo-acid transaminase